MKRVLACLLLAVAVLGCSGPTGSGAAGGATYEVAGRAVAGPTCPVEPASPIPGQCEPRPVSGAVLVVTRSGGGEAARVTTGRDGRFSVALAAGSYTLTPQAVSGLMGVAPPIVFTVAPSTVPSDLRVEYDTGIR